MVDQLDLQKSIHQKLDISCVSVRGPLCFKHRMQFNFNHEQVELGDNKSPLWKFHKTDLHCLAALQNQGPCPSHQFRLQYGEKENIDASTCSEDSITHCATLT